MPNIISLSLVQIERFRRDAKKISRETNVNHSEALDRIAGEHGYRNWSHLMKHNPHTTAGERAGLPPFRLSRSVDDMRRAIRKNPDLENHRHAARGLQAAVVARDVSQDFVSASNSVSFAVEYMETLLEVPRFHVHVSSQALFEMRFWLPYCVHPMADTDARILVNREYKPVGHITDKRVPYEQFHHLHLQINPVQVKAITGPRSSEGYLYNDGCNPWWSRKNAEDYLEQLRRLQAIL